MLQREIFAELLQELNQTEVTVLIGPRQVGKSTLMLELAKEFNKQKISTSYFDLEDPQTLADFNLEPAAILDLLDQTQAQVIFIDEFHYLKNASKIFKTIYDRGVRDTSKRIKIYASGSSSVEMHKHLKESLAGRKNSFEIYILSFNELKQEISFDDYLVYGGLPGLTHKENDNSKLQLLNNILKTYIEKDIKSLVKEENLSAFNHLLRIIAFRQGQVTEHSSIANEIRTSSHTVQRYFDLLNSSFVVTPLYSFARNLSNELKKSKKYYFFDTGIRNLLVENFEKLDKRQDKGVLYETYVFNYLRSKLLPNMSLKFWRTKQKQEIDFILVKNQIPYPIEVKSKLQRPEISAAFFSFAQAYPETKDCFIVNESLDLIVDAGDFKVHFVKIAELETYPLLSDILDSVR